MPRIRTGTIARNAAGAPVGVKCYTAAGERVTMWFLPSHAAVSEEEATRRQPDLVALAARCVREGSGDTVAEWSSRWLTSRTERGLSTVRNDRGRLSKWVLPTLGALPIASVAKRDLEAFVEKLDLSVRRKELNWKTAQNVWGLVSKMFSDAATSKVLALRVREDNPARDVKGPDRGGERSSPYLFPSELLALVTCEAVSHYRRLTYALAVYTYARRGELVALTWEDVSLDAGCILVHRAEDFDTRETKATKTKATRRIPIEPALRPLLEARQGEAGEKVLLRVPHSSELAWMLREDLKRAGVTREELFAKDATRRPLDFHDLRHTGITWRAIRGDDPLKIQRAAGHSDFATTQRYINEAESFDAHAGAPFPPLPLASLASCPAAVPLDRSRAKTPGKVASPGGFENDASHGLENENRAQNTGDATVKPSEQAEQSGQLPSVETFRTKLDAAIVAEQWEAVKVIAARIRELESANVIPLDRRRVKA